MGRAAVTVAVVLIILVVLFFAPVLRDQPWTPLRIAGIAIALVGLVFLVITHINLGASFAFGAQPKGPLVTHGIYSKIRNPMYVFVDVTVAGLLLAADLPWLLVLIPIWAIFQVRQAGREARMLQEKFGQAYLDYRKKTWF